jgi:hypothetical protein
MAVITKFTGMLKINNMQKFQQIKNTFVPIGHIPINLVGHQLIVKQQNQQYITILVTILRKYVFSNLTISNNL